MLALPHSHRARRLLGWSLLLLPLACNSPAASQTTDRTAENTAAGRFQVDLKQSVRYLASDELEGRGVGTEGLNRAAEFVAETFKELGLRPPPGQDGYFQPFKVTTAVRPAASTTIRFGGG